MPSPKNLFAIAVILLTPLFVASAQTITTNYNQVVIAIRQLQHIPLRQYNATNAGPLLDEILGGLMVFTNASDAGLKKRLVNMGVARMERIASNAVSAIDAAILPAIYYTAQSPVPTFISDPALRARLKNGTNYGVAVLRNEETFWKRKVVSNSLAGLEQCPSNLVAALVPVIANATYSHGALTYENARISFASKQLLGVFNDMRTVELAEHSPVVKLLVTTGYITIPTNTTAQFLFSGLPAITFALPRPQWTSDDIPALERLSANPLYATIAQAELAILTSQ